ncbi:hypothetical protein GCM10027040_27310 [Halomonas shantousis]
MNQPDVTEEHVIQLNALAQARRRIDELNQAIREMNERYEELLRTAEQVCNAPLRSSGTAVRLLERAIERVREVS